MNHRRLRLPAAMALLVLAAPVFAADPSGADADRSGVAANIHREAREFGNSVRQGSQQVGHDVAHGVHQFRHEFTVRWYQTGRSIRQWWSNTRDGISRI